MEDKCFSECNYTTTNQDHFESKLTIFAAHLSFQVQLQGLKLKCCLNLYRDNIVAFILLVNKYLIYKKTVIFT